MIVLAVSIVSTIVLILFVVMVIRTHRKTPSPAPTPILPVVVQPIPEKKVITKKASQPTFMKIGKGTGGSY